MLGPGAIAMPAAHEPGPWAVGPGCRGAGPLSVTGDITADQVGTEVRRGLPEGEGLRQPAAVAQSDHAGVQAIDDRGLGRIPTGSQIWLPEALARFSQEFMLSPATRMLPRPTSDSTLPKT